MKKLFAVLVLMLLVSLFVSALVVGSAQAGQENDVWQKVHAAWPDEHGYYKGAPNGVVHEKWSCNSDWKDCDGAALYFPVDGFEEPPSDTPCGADISQRVWNGTDEYPGDDADVSDFLVIGESYWFCDTLGEELFRGSE
jgi:hypothetical protein